MISFAVHITERNLAATMRYLLCILAILFTIPALAQLQKGTDYEVTCIAFYNLENLFDTIDDPTINDEEFLPNGKNVWNTEKYLRKLDNMAEVIAQLGTEVTPFGPAILGVSEIENRRVLEDLANHPKLKKHNYQIVHHDGPDRRGVDCALFYQPRFFELVSSKSYRLTLEGDTSFRSRDQLLVSGKLNGELMHFMVTHWPSRRGGQKKSEPKRIAAAELGRSIIDSLLTIDPNAKCIYMGDLNDDPNNKSVSKVMMATGRKAEAAGSKLYNPMLPLFQKGVGTLAWRDTWNLFDQLLLTPALANGDYHSQRYYTAKVFNKEFLKQKDGSFAGYPFRTFAGGSWLGGYSDHFPVYVLLVKEK